MSNYSVLVQDVVKSYGHTQILKKLCMTVEKGQIYGLLGSSGCGKTTLLNAIVGRKRIESGEIWVLGGKPGDPASGVPGPKVGYMPQEISLTREFTVKDAIFYFGRIYNMKESDIKARYKELLDLLHLPPDDRSLKDCSGGQQRRVSFAVALIHQPKLLILDEPTVGIDPLLREKIWSYLIDITKRENLSVIITTHYIEECRQADKIGLMRDGRLLTEDSPANLLRTFNTDTLEEVFLSLSRQQEAGVLPEKSQAIGSFVESSLHDSAASVPSDWQRYSSTEGLTKQSRGNFGFVNKRRMNAMFDKNLKQFYRNVFAVLFLLLIPVIVMLVTIYSIGLDMKNIPIGIINDEEMSAHCPDFSLNDTVLVDKSHSCHFHNLSCRFLKYHLDHPMIKKVEYDSIDTAIDDVTHGKLYGIMYFAENYSSYLEQRLHDDISASNEVLDLSTIKVRLDMSNQQIGISVKNKLTTLYLDFQKSLFKDCKFAKGFGDLPVQTNYEYGSMDEPYQIFMMPGIVITMTFFFGSMMTSQILITEKLEGVWDRSIIAGATSLELIISHFSFQACIAVIQSLEVIILLYGIYQYEYVGSLFLVYALIYLEGICGMAFGLFVSASCSNISMASNATLGFYLPLIVLSGCIWPLQGMSNALQTFARLLPVAVPIETLIKITKKGLSVDSWQVIPGLATPVIWTVIFVVLSIIFMKRQQ
ncbi:unnamed protein product [Phyllotreta striolata]|uniref:Uncharacterized protein n=1 Tax=Phyllotreta striolata TaxID=444603 RepID=A0A9N9TKA6_PHYSR|nr:unnamed protein product [Phyllotreta striolata]